MKTTVYMCGAEPVQGARLLSVFATMYPDTNVMFFAPSMKSANSIMGEVLTLLKSITDSFGVELVKKRDWAFVDLINGSVIDILLMSNVMSLFGKDRPDVLVVDSRVPSLYPVDFAEALDRFGVEEGELIHVSYGYPNTINEHLSSEGSL